MVQAYLGIKPRERDAEDDGNHDDLFRSLGF